MILLDAARASLSADVYGRLGHRSIGRTEETSFVLPKPIYYLHIIYVFYRLLEPTLADPSAFHFFMKARRGAPQKAVVCHPARPKKIKMA